MITSATEFGSTSLEKTPILLVTKEAHIGVALVVSSYNVVLILDLRAMSTLISPARRILAFIGWLGYLTTLPQVSPMMLVNLLHGGHEMQVVAHDGHEDLLLHQDANDHEHATTGAADEHGSHAQSHAGHQHHHDHIVCLDSSNHDGTIDAPAAWSPLLTVARVERPAVVCLPAWSTEESPPLARPPPLIRSHTLVCLRTKVLLV